MSTHHQMTRALAGIRRYLDEIEQLAYEFVAVYRALREAIGDAAALVDARVQSARRAWLSARDCELHA
jgi:hypothetical protein